MYVYVSVMVCLSVDARCYVLCMVLMCVVVYMWCSYVSFVTYAAVCESTGAWGHATSSSHSSNVTELEASHTMRQARYGYAHLDTHRDDHEARYHVRTCAHACCACVLLPPWLVVSCVFLCVSACLDMEPVLYMCCWCACCVRVSAACLIGCACYRSV